MKIFWYTIIFLLFCSGLVAQVPASLGKKEIADLDIVFAIVEKSNDNTITENQIAGLLDSLVALSGSESKVTLTQSGKTEISGAIRVKEENATYSVGDKANGGVIFWVDNSGRSGLVAAPADQSDGETWYNDKTDALKDGVFTGKYNTEQIIANKSAGYFAAQKCAYYEGGGYHDWYLPSKYELKLMYTKKSIIGGFARDFYWSSTEDANNFAWLLSFYGGYFSNYIKYGSTLFRVRAIRAF